MAIYIGIDGGGTKTLAMVFDDTINVAAALKTGPSNPNTIGWHGTKHVIASLIEAGLCQLKSDASKVTGICVALAGAGSSPHSSLKEELQKQFVNAEIDICIDALAVLTAGTKGKSGVALIAGTGSIAVAEDDNGNVNRVGGFGYLFGDEGSGFYIGREGLMAAIQSVEGRGEQTDLTERAFEYFEIRNLHEFIPVIYHAQNPVQKIAGFAPSVIDLFERDQLATNIIEHASKHHAKLVLSLLKKMNPHLKKLCVVSGGLFSEATPFQCLLHKQLNEWTVSSLDVPAAVGAVLRAMGKRFLHDAKEDTDRARIQTLLQALKTNTQEI